MTIYYLKALLIYFWKPFFLSAGLLVIAYIVDYISRTKRAQYSITVSDGSLESLKWLAAFVMVADHINKFVLSNRYSVIFDAGRVVMPIFVFVFAYNLTRLNHIPNKIYWRLFAFGVAACVPLFLMQPVNNWFPLNIMFTLLAGAFIIMCINSAGAYYFLAVVIFCIVGALVEYWWPCLGLIIGVYYIVKKKSLLAATLTAISLYYLQRVNGNHWALASIPVILLVCSFKFELKRIRWFFYAFYPVHLLCVYGLLFFYRVAT